MNRPSRTDYYLMRLALLQLSDPPDSLEDLKIDITYPDARKDKFVWTKEGADAATAKSKAAWLPKIGFKQVPE